MDGQLDDEVGDILPTLAYALAKIHMLLVHSGFVYTARGGFAYTEDDIFEYYDGPGIDGSTSERIEITCFHLDGSHYMVYTPVDPVFFIAVKDQNGQLQIADDDFMEDPGVTTAIDEETEFNSLVVTMPRDALHYGGVEHREIHNAYGYYFHMATADGLVKRGDGKDRPFVLSRVVFPGSQRHGAVWTGDNTAEWEHLRVSVPMILTLGLTGVTFSGADVGGFFGNPEPELLVRWYQLGAYYPFFRGHAHHDTKRREPWLFGERNTELTREAIHLRYILLPYFYTLFREANTTGVPVMHPLSMEFPDDEATFSKDETFMVGSSLLVQGIFTERAKHASVYLPGEQPWYYLSSGTAYKGGTTHKIEVLEDSVPAFQRAGTIIPRKDRFRRSSTQMENDPYTLVIALNSTQEAEGKLYIDDGKSFEFARGAYIHWRFVFSAGKLTSSNMAPSTPGKSRFSSDCTVERIILLGYSPRLKSAVIEPSNQKADIELGPLYLRNGRSPTVPTIRNPNVRIEDDWTISVS